MPAVVSTDPGTGQVVTSPWVPGRSVEVTQPWGATSYAGEPSGHGAPHWHAGIDLGYPSNTIVVLPQITSDGVKQQLINAGLAVASQLAGGLGQISVTGTFHRGVWNGNGYSPDPNGYGNHATTITLQATFQTPIPNVGANLPLADVILGHGVSWDQADGATVRAGDHLIHTDNEGNSSGPHLHFEVRPVKGGYGTDVNPSNLLINGVGSAVTDAAGNIANSVGSDVQAAAAAIAGSITGGVHDFENLFIGMGAAGLGAGFIGLSVWMLVRTVKPPSVGAGPRPPGRSAAVQPVHPAARVARATRAAPAAPIPSTPAQAVPVRAPVRVS